MISIRVPVAAAIFLVAAVVPLPVYAKCSDMTVCRTDPATGQQVCKTYKNVCSDVIPELNIESSSPDNNNSIELHGLSKKQLDDVLGKIGVDESKVK